MKILLFIFSFILTFNAGMEVDRWGKTGHRIVGDVAQNYLNNEASRAVKHILSPQSMAMASTWMDGIRSDPKYDYTHDWHWVTIPKGMSYEDTQKNPDGDLIKAIQTSINKLKSGALSSNEEVKNLKMLIHLVGDIHQPLHVGNGKDRGGNDLKIKWFYKYSNLHRLWDTQMIEDTKLSYTEFSSAINHPSKRQIKKWQDTNVLDWAYESRNLRKQVYDLPADNKLGYEYQYKQHNLLNEQLLKAGVRLAGVLNDIYG